MDELRQRPPLTVVVPPPIWAVLFLTAGWAAGRWLGLEPLVDADILAGALVLAGLSVATWGRLTFARVGTEVVPVSPANRVLVTHGPFAYTRNPMYLGLLLLTGGIAIWIGTATALAAPVAYFFFVNGVSIPFEEAKMERQYTDRFRAYKARVRRWL